MKKLLFLTIFSCLLIPFNTLKAEEVAEQTTVETEEVVFRPIARGLYAAGRGVYRAGKGVYNVVKPELYKVSVYTRDGQMVEFYRRGETAYTLKKRIQANALIGRHITVWGSRTPDGKLVRIPLHNVQNISVSKVRAVSCVLELDDNLTQPQSE